jgi:Holliday junction resolvasome RuvABC endonuclease subunit
LQRCASARSILGLDPSLTHTALVLGTVDETGSSVPESVESYRIKVDLAKYPHTVARLAALTARLESILEAVEEEHQGPGVLVLEGYAFSSKNKREALGEWGGQVRLTAYRRGWVLAIAAPNTVKKFVTGSGVAEKDKMMMEVLDKWDYKASDNNNADAYALMRMGMVIRRRVVGEAVTQKDLDTLKSVEICLPAV